MRQLNLHDLLAWVGELQNDIPTRLKGPQTLQPELGTGSYSIVIGRVREEQREQALFLQILLINARSALQAWWGSKRTVSCMRAMLRAMTAKQPMYRGDMAAASREEPSP